MTARHIYVDETKQRDYLLVASVHVTTELAALRQLIRGLLLPGQRYLHMKNEKDGRKRTIAQALVDAGVQATIYRAGAPTTATNANAAQRAYAPSSKTTPTPATHTSCSTRTKPW